MGTVPNPAQPEQPRPVSGTPDTTSIVDRAEDALRSWSGVSTREQAAQLLDGWKHARNLTAQQRAEVLARFGEPVGEHIDMVSRCEICTRRIEHVAGIPDPYWRHREAAGGRPHAARPVVSA
jgi:hypothetical protein